MELGDSIIISTVFASLTWVAVTLLQNYTVHQTSLPGMLLTLKGKVVQ
jgi:hypothetical protein